MLEECMSQNYQKLSQSKVWFADTPLAKLTLGASKISTLATEKGSLTSALMTLSNGEFKVNVLKQELAIPYWHEQQKLRRRLSQVAYIREVELLIHDQVVVFARTIIPHTLVGKRLQTLGKTPLGHLLFKNGKIRVSKRQFALTEYSNQNIQARRTPYDYQGETILVSEFFLPKLRDYLY